jgi:hypothetical protein
MPLEEQRSGHGHFIPAELRPRVGVDMADQEAPLEPGTSKGDLRQRARAAMEEVERVQLEVEDEGLTPEMWDTIVVRSPNVNSTVLDKEAVLLNLENGVYYTLNPVGTVIWELVTGERTLTEVLSALCERYDDVSEDAARRDLVTLVARLRREGLIAERR